MRKISKWVSIIFFSLIIVLLIAGTLRQSMYDSKITDQFPPYGEFSELGANKIHYSYSGTGDHTFVLIAGLGESMHTWSEIKNDLEVRGRVFMYDRSGLGHSEAGSLPRSVDMIATELKSVLDNESVSKPYVLIGHSAGGFTARYFANKYPKDIAGLFILDTYKEMGKDEFGDWPLSYKIMNWMFRNMSWSGIPFILLPEPPHPVYKTSLAIRTFGEEAHSERVSLDQFRQIEGENRDLPFYILTADQPENPYRDLYRKWDRQISESYTNDINKHIVVASGHHIHIDRPDIVLEQLDDFLRRIQNM